MRDVPAKGGCKPSLVASAIVVDLDDCVQAMVLNHQMDGQGDVVCFCKGHARDCDTSMQARLDEGVSNPQTRSSPSGQPLRALIPKRGVCRAVRYK